MPIPYSATQNNGKIASQTDVLSGEQVTYTYDSLNRLATAQTSDNPSVTQWGQSYNYDGFGNLTRRNSRGIFRKLGYNGVTNPTEEAVTKAIDNFGEGDGRYGQAVMDCAGEDCV